MSESEEIYLIEGVHDGPKAIIIYGTPCIGKSSMAADFPKPVIVQTETVGGSVGASRLPLVKTWDDFVAQLKAIHSRELGDFKTVVVDSMKFLEQIIVKKVCADRGISSLDDEKYGVAYGAAMRYWYVFLDMMDRFLDDGVNVVLIGHETQRTVKDPRIDEYESTTIDLMKWGKTYDPVKSLACWADCVLYLAHKLYTRESDTGIGGTRTTATSTGERIIYTEERPAYLAKNRFSMPPELPYKKGEGYKVIENYLKTEEN